MQHGLMFVKRQHRCRISCSIRVYNVEINRKISMIGHLYNCLITHMNLCQRLHGFTVKHTE